MKSKTKKIIAITLGDPGGIGPEVIARSLQDPEIRRLADFLVIGHRAIYRQYLSGLPKGYSFLDLNDVPESKLTFGKPNKYNALASLQYLDQAINLLKEKKVCALVTGPVCKEAISSLGEKFIGHTEYIAKQFNTANFAMMFVADKLKTITLTRHVPLVKVSSLIACKNIYETIVLTHKALKTNFKIRNPAIGVCGLNPHAGEGGSFGLEEIQKIIPAIKKAKQKNIRVFGPLSADTTFCPVNVQKYDCIIAMYHDQGIIPIKTLYFDHVVNLTIGLPFIRTSPAHGTAFDIVKKNKAHSESMSAAIKLAAQLSAGN